MADEQSIGTTETAVPAPAVVPEPVAPAPTEAPPARYGGKSPDELARELEESQARIQELADRAARAEYEATYTRNLMEQFGQNRRQPEATATVQPEVTDDEFLQNPAKATAKIVQHYFQMDKAERDRREKEQYIQAAKSNYESGRNTALKQNPRVFAGIEADVSKEVFTAFEKGMVNADALRDPGFWEASAAIIRFARGERNLEKYYHSQPTPVAPAHTEVPNASIPPKVEPTLSVEQEELIQRAGITREQFLQSMAKVRAADAERKR